MLLTITSRGTLAVVFHLLLLHSLVVGMVEGTSKGTRLDMAAVELAVATRATWDLAMITI